MKAPARPEFFEDPCPGANKISLSDLKVTPKQKRVYHPRRNVWEKRSQWEDSYSSRVDRSCWSFNSGFVQYYLEGGEPTWRQA